jgi:hypothetical protein
MQENDDPIQKLQANPGHVVNQLLRAMSTSATHPDPAARQRALERVKRWKQVFRGMFDGSISAGSRTPIRGIPGWLLWTGDLRSVVWPLVDLFNPETRRVQSEDDGSEY